MTADFSVTKSSGVMFTTYVQDMCRRKFLDPHPSRKRRRSAGRPLATRRRTRQRTKRSTSRQVFHKHHILPRALYPEFEKKDWNIVLLSLEEHFDAHVALTKIMPDEIATHRALNYMTKRFVKPHGFDWQQAEASEKVANAAASVLQRILRLTDWKRLPYRLKMSAIRSFCNYKNWRDPIYRSMQSLKIWQGRQRFYEDPEAVARSTAAQSAKTSGKKHWRFKPVNIYRHETGELVAAGVCLSEFCKQHRPKKLNQGHMHATMKADRTRPSTGENRAHTGGYFARGLDEDGNVIGLVCPAVPQPDHHHARRANIYRAADDVCVAENVIISQFRDHNNLGKKFSQSALSKTATADRTQPSTGKNPLAHKGYYARYCDTLPPAKT